MQIEATMYEYVLVYSPKLQQQHRSCAWNTIVEWKFASTSIPAAPCVCVCCV